MAPRGIAGEDPDLLQEVDMMIRISRSTGCPLTFLLAQNNSYPAQWREVMAKCTAAVEGGVRIVPMVFARPVCVLFSFQGDNPFEYLPSFQPLKKLSHSEKIAALRNPELRQKLVTEKDPYTTGMSLLYQNPLVWERTYPMGQPLSYEPDSKNSIAAIAKREGRSPREVIYDLMLEQNGRAFLMYAAAVSRRQVLPGAMQPEPLFDERQTDTKHLGDVPHRQFPLFDGGHHSTAQFFRIGSHTNHTP